MNAILLLAAGGIPFTWHLLPLAAVVSLVYSASRFELPAAIIHRAVRLFITILVFMAAILVVLVILSHNL